jgi:type VI protein secretion system component VasK
MSLVNIAVAAAEELAAKYIWRLLGALLTALFALIAVYHLTVAGELALEVQFGAINARLIVAGIYVALTLAGAGMVWAMRRKAAAPSLPGEPSPRAMQIAMLVEAAMLGFELSRKNEKTS